MFGVDLEGDVDLRQDVTSPGAAEAIVKTALRTMGGLDSLVTCAGISKEMPIDTHDDALWDLTLAVNVTAVFRLVRAAVPALRTCGSGRVVTIGSVMSSFAAPGLAAYTASKHAVLGLTRAMACELGPDRITVNCVQPGAIVTPMTQDYLGRDDLSAFWKRKAALGRLGTPEDVADVIAFLVSDDARFLTGQGILVDGGAMQQI